MAIVQTTPITRREFAGFDDPSLPEGIYQAGAFTTGDGTGGNITQIFEFNSSAARRDARFYSLEYLTLTQAGDGGSREIELAITNLGSVLGAIFRRWRFQFLSSVSLARTALPGDVYSFLPVFLGRQSLPNSNSTVFFTLANTDTVITSYTIEGYMWGARSINAPGGPSRPLQGMYPR